MEHTQAQNIGQDTVPGGMGWRAFQIVGLVTALTWLVSYVVFLNGYEAFQTIFGLSNPLYILGGIGYGLSPIMSLALVVIAFWPGALGRLTRSDLPALVARAVLLVVPTLWLGAVFLGDSSMITAMVNAPLGRSSALGIVGGNVIHVVFQHWFQGSVAIALALVPSRFGTLTLAERPAGIQCAVVGCE